MYKSFETGAVNSITHGERKAMTDMRNAMMEKTLRGFGSLSAKEPKTRAPRAIPETNSYVIDKAARP
jgi:hypothetical protein